MDQHNLWQRLGQRAAADKKKVLILAGTIDATIIFSELKDDASATLGAESIDWRDIEGGHDFPITMADRVVEEVTAFWGI
jgi:hypothetical protein